ncbi:hypothetical protein HPB50_019719 [Hyalomma asiaticum]|uniref:Uncharacterized protein n=1 Tax=Hyalomma asiaticum TaxID=266040 RepID=A0ACB7SS08_HYAAI|nr:hypothetical protein HPB50_019719 [Hyalomma asiaticum]
MLHTLMKCTNVAEFEQMPQAILGIRVRETREHTATGPEVDLVRQRCVAFTVKLSNELRQCLPSNFKVLQVTARLSVGACLRVLKEPITELPEHFGLQPNKIDLVDTQWKNLTLDQTMVRMDSPASRTNNMVWESTVRIANTGCARRGFTVALAACAKRHKLPACIVLKEASGRIPTKAFVTLRIPGLDGFLKTAESLVCKLKSQKDEGKLQNNTCKTRDTGSDEEPHAEQQPA